MEIILSDFSTKVQFDPSNPQALFHAIVDYILIPFYTETNDWNESIRKAINELKKLATKYRTTCLAESKEL